MGVALLALGLFALFTAVSRTKPQTPQPRLTADDLEQQKYDARQQENEQLKAAQLRNDGFLVRKDEDTTLQLNNLMKDLQKDDGFPVHTTDPKQTRAEEEAIAGVIRDPRQRSACTLPTVPGLDRRVGAAQMPRTKFHKAAPSPCSSIAAVLAGPSTLRKRRTRWRLRKGPKVRVRKSAAPPRQALSEVAQKPPGAEGRKDPHPLHRPSPGDPLRRRAARCRAG